MTLARLLVVTAMIGIVVLAGCSKDDDESTTPVNSNSKYTNDIKAAPVYLNLTSGDSVSTWDIAFVRSASGSLPVFRVNGGIFGSKGFYAAKLDTNFAGANQDPTTWSTDVDSTILAIGDAWANYNPTTHAITGYDSITYILKYDAYPYIKFHVLNYGSGTVRFQFAYSDSVVSSQIYWGTTRTDSIYGAVAGTPKPYRFGTGMVSENDWQFAMVTSWFNTGGIGNVKYPYGRLNKTAGVQASWLDMPYDQVSSVPTSTVWHTDSDTLYTSWIFTYNSSNHHLTPLNKTLLVKHSAHVWKISFDDYYNNQGTIGFVTYRYSMLP